MAATLAIILDHEMTFGQTEREEEPGLMMTSWYFG